MISFNFNKEKTLNVILYIAEKLQRKDLHKVFKILYFSDREYLANYGYPITGDTYIAMEAGPVPSKVYDIIKIVRGDSYKQDTENFKSYFCIESNQYIKPNKEADLRKISRAEIKIIDQCLNLYGALSYSEIKEKSHDMAWHSTTRDSAINIEDIAIEVGITSKELSYVTEMSQRKTLDAC